MKKLYSSYLIFSLLLFSSIIFAGAAISRFTAYGENDKVYVEWETREEINLKHFVIMRADISGNFFDYATITPKGSNSSYKFVDENVFKINKSLYKYKLKIVDLDGSISYTGQITVAAPSVSSVKRTWGSIKALFR